jgi:hypothetical protein
MKKTKTVPELFARGDLVRDTIFSQSKENGPSVSYDMKA